MTLFASLCHIKAATCRNAKFVVLVPFTCLTMFLISSIAKFFTNIYIGLWDISLTLFNLVTPKRPVGKVIPEGSPGAGGKWPEFIAPKEGDSRSACPALNALANHGA